MSEERYQDDEEPHKQVDPPPPVGGGGGQPSGGSESLYDAVAQIYRTALGREGSPAEIQSWIAGKSPNDLASIQQGIYASQEAKTYSGKTTAAGTAKSGSSSWQDAYSNRPSDLATAIQRVNQFAYGGQNKHDDQSYWESMWAKDPGYAWDRMWGKGAGESDAASAGPWAGGDPNAEKPGASAPAKTTGDSGSGYDLASYMTDSPLLSPWTQQFSFPDWKPTDKFAAPSLEDAKKDPGYEFGADQGRNQIQRSAAARGTLLTGGTLKDLYQFGDDYATTKYGDVYNRKMGEWLNQRNASLQDWTTNYNKAKQAYDTSYNIFENNQAKQYNRISNLAGLGQTAAGQLGSAGLGYSQLAGSVGSNNANTLAGLYTGAANATAAGQVGGANAWNSAFSNISNMGSLYGLAGLTGGGSSSAPSWARFFGASS